MKKILIVDDDTIVRITLRTLIPWKQFGYEVAADAVHGKQALQYMEAEPVDLVITDMKMPVMDGLSLIEEISRRGWHPQILVLSGYDDFKLVREAFRLGAVDYLLKSDLTPELMESMLKKLEHRTGELAEAGREPGGESGQNSGPESGQNSGAESRQNSGAESGQNSGAESRQNSRQNPRPEAGQKTGSKQNLAPVGWREADRTEKGRRLADLAMGRRETAEIFFPEAYLVVQFEIDDYRHQAARFSDNLEEKLIEPFLTLAGQIPRVASRCVIGSLSPSRYLMLYEVTDRQIYRDNVASVCRQLCSVWKNYLNLLVSAGVSQLETDPAAFADRVEEAGRQLRLYCLKGRMQLCVPWDGAAISYEETEEAGERYQRLLAGLWDGDEMAVETEKGKLVGDLHLTDLKQAVRLCQSLICRLSWMVLDHQEDLFSLFPEEINYYEKMDRFLDVRELERWMNNYFRWFLDYQRHYQERNHENLILKAKKFILDNYSNPELTLGSVAGYVGLNEKYFSTRFTREEGMTFSNYVMEVRIRKAKELMDQTNLKIYEISQSVGYNSVEHFTRVFKKVCKISPGSYRREG